MQTNISVHPKQDGTWLEFTASNGQSVIIRAEDFVSDHPRALAGPLARSAMSRWIEDRRSERHHHVAGTTVGKHIDECAKCGQDLRSDIHIR